MRRDIFQAIADPVRREILEIISDKPLSVNQVAENFQISRQAISKQLKILNECGLIAVNQEGRERYFYVKPDSLIPAFMWIDQLQKRWENKVDSFELYVEKLQKEKDDKRK